MSYITCTVDARGNLALTLAPEDREEWAERLEAVGDESALWEFMEGYWANGSYQPFDAGQGNPFVGLTDALCIAESMDIDDEGRNSIVGEFWYWQSATRSYGEELRDTGQAVFTLAR